MQRIVSLLAKLLGWETEGKTSLKDNHLSFLNFEENSFLLTNNIPLIGDKIRFSLDLDVIENVGKAKNEQAKIGGKEVLMFGLSNNMLDIDSYKENGTEIRFQGYMIYLLRHKNAVIFVNSKTQLNKVDLRDAFTLAKSKRPDHSCEFNYLKRGLKMELIVDFQQKKISGRFDDLYCFNIKMDFHVLPKSKVSLTFMGYSTVEAPIHININAITAEKIITNKYGGLYLNNLDIKPNKEGFLQNFERYDPGLKSKSSLNSMLFLDVI